MTQEVTLYPEPPSKEALTPPAPPVPPQRQRPQPTKKASPGNKAMPIRLTPRDFAVLSELLTVRYMTALQLQALYWKEKKDEQNGPLGLITAARRRLKQLHDTGLVRRIIPLVQQHTGGKSPLLYALDKAGAQMLGEHLGIELAAIDYKPHEREANWPFLQHLLDTTDVRILITQAVEAQGLRLEFWYNELDLRSDDLCDVVSITDPDGTNHKAAVVPDALCCLRNTAGKQAIFAIEIDRRTVTVEPNPNNWAKRGWMRKIRTYTAYFASDAYQQRYGELVIYVLTITTGGVRLNHLQQATEKVTTSRRFFFTTFDQLTADTALTERIWQRANDEGLHSLLKS